jgi:ATP-dependent RNA helicase CshB
MNRVKNLDYQYIVATDLKFARGIDIEGVSHVINDAIPQDLSFFVRMVVQDVTVYRVLPLPLSTE